MITVCGEGLIDLVPLDRAGGPQSALRPALGGGPFNVAVATARLGAPVQFLSRLSTDAFGTALFSALEDNGVSGALVQRGPEPTTLAVTSINGDGSASFSFYTEGTADRFVQPPQVASEYACFGTVSLALEPGASRYLELLRRMSAAGSLIALDPNIRPLSATAAHRQRLLDVLPAVHLLKLTEEEVEFLGGSGALSAVPVLVTTRGEDGLSLRHGATHLDVPAVPVEVVDTIGAGDTVMAALLSELHDRGIGVVELADVSAPVWREILETAVVAAAVTCTRQGADPPTRAEILALGRVSSRRR